MTNDNENKKFLDIATILEEIKAKINIHYAKTIDCDPGWHHLVAQCHIELMMMDPNYEVYQIKEKFGSLRYYFGTKSSDIKEVEMWKIAEKYELLSQKVCELTGKPGKLMFQLGLYKTLAEEYTKEGWEPVEKVSPEKLFGI